MNIELCRSKIVLMAALLFISVVAASAQTTVFTYQGRFIDATVPQPTNGTYNMSFALYDAATGGNQVGAAIAIPAVHVTNGIFTVSLDYTAAAFDGTARFVEITVTNTVLTPRQEITNAPYAIMAQNALRANRAIDSNQLGGINADQYVTGQVVRRVNGLTGDVTLAAGPNITITPAGNTMTIASIDANAVNNQTTLQAGANFNIDGTGSGNIFNAATQFNIGGVRVLSVAGDSNLFAGSGAGAANTGNSNSFLGTNAGLSNLAGFNNTFAGTDSGRNNSTGSHNSFFGRSSGFATTTGSFNSFFGLDAGRFNTTGNNNSFFGNNAGNSNTTGGDNSYFGIGAGNSNLTSFNNSFFGTDSGRGTTAGDNSFFGRSAGFANTIGTRNVFIGVDAGRFSLTGGSNTFLGTAAASNNTTGGNNTVIGDSANLGGGNLTFATALGSGAIASASNTVVLGRPADTVVVPNLLQVGSLGSAGGTSLCRNASNQISTCTAGGSSGSFIDNSTLQQPNSNFNVSGAGTVGGLLSANIVNTATNFKIGGVPVFSTPNGTTVVAGQSANHASAAGTSAFFGFKAGQAANGFSSANTFIGSDAGETTTGGSNNSFVGKDAGFLNSSGSYNSFFGSGAGLSNSTASSNSFFGFSAGTANTTGTRNSFFGFQAGQATGTSNDNAFFGYQSGVGTTGGTNAFFGSSTGPVNTNGGENTFIGNSSGPVNSSGSQNTFVGASAGTGNTTGDANTAIGYQSKTVNGDGNTVVGSLSYADGVSNITLGHNAGSTGDQNTTIGYFSFATGNSNTTLGYHARVQGASPREHSTAIGADAVADLSNSIVLGTEIDSVYAKKDLFVTGFVVAGQFTGNSVFAGDITATGQLKTILMSGGSTAVCRNAQSILSTCSSSLRYKTNIAPYSSGLNLLSLLHPITFDWKDGGMHDLGFGAEDVQKVDPLLVTYNADGQVEGVKYDRITTVLVNSVNEQQVQIAAQTEQIKQQQAQIDALKQMLCALKPGAQICGK